MDRERCNAQPFCGFVEGGPGCRELSLDCSPPTEGEIFLTRRSFYPQVFLGRLGEFSCGEVYSIGSNFVSIPAVVSMLEQWCCGVPTRPPTAPPPTTAVVTTQEPSAAPTLHPTVEGGSTLEFSISGDYSALSEDDIIVLRY